MKGLVEGQGPAPT